MKKVCFSHINLLLLGYIFLPLEITSEIPLPGKLIETVSVFEYF